EVPQQAAPATTSSPATPQQAAAATAATTAQQATAATTEGAHHATTGQLAERFTGLLGGFGQAPAFRERGRELPQPPHTGGAPGAHTRRDRQPGRAGGGVHGVAELRSSGGGGVHHPRG